MNNKKIEGADQMNEPQLFNFNGQPTLDSREVAKMISKRHRDLMRDIRDYIKVIKYSAKLRSTDFFVESTYKASNGKVNPCYLLTKKGCEFVANKMTGKKGTLFTAQYVSLFNSMQVQIKFKLNVHNIKFLKLTEKRCSLLLTKQRLLNNSNRKSITTTLRCTIRDL